MDWVAHYLWLVPVLPLLAAGLTAVMPRARRAPAAVLAIGSLGLSLVLSLGALMATVGGNQAGLRQVHNFEWMALGDGTLRLGWMLDPLSAVMLVMVTFVGLLIFVYSVGYMSHDADFTRFFCFLALFAAAMLGLVIANSLLLAFICWELVGLASYLLIGFWHQKPAAAAAARKAFITTRVGDLGFLLGMVWLYGETGTLLFHDEGRGCLEQAAVAQLVSTVTVGGMAAGTAVSLLIFCGAMGKSGQFPLHVWLPDAMEGPTPVSALIHAATMVAAGVFLVARVYPVMSAVPGGSGGTSTALVVVTWIGALTAVFAALIAVAQTDIKRILAYSTVSQLGYMFLGLGVGGVAVGLFHLITHAFFKALLFLAAGSVIHGSHGEQDIRRLGGLRPLMPVTFATYALGMLALTGVPVFAGFWSKDGILHAAHGWPASPVPFYLGLFGALLTAFYMTRQMALVFLGDRRDRREGVGTDVHESPAVMTVPLIILAVCVVLLGFLGTPFWPLLQRLLEAPTEPASVGVGVLGLMFVSTVVAGIGLAAGWWLYGRKVPGSAEAVDPLETYQPGVFGLLRRKFLMDELYAVTAVRWTTQAADLCQWVDRVLLGALVGAVSYAVWGLAWLNRLADEYVLNLGFDRSCRSLQEGGQGLGKLQDGQVQHYLRALGLAFTALLLLLTWGCSR